VKVESVPVQSRQTKDQLKRIK